MSQLMGVSNFISYSHISLENHIDGILVLQNITALQFIITGLG